MYYQYFNLEKKPFQINSDNKFLWLGKKHATALESLKKGIGEKQGLLALTGDVGTGKTTLLNEIIHTLDAKTLFVKIADPGIEMYHLFLTIAQAFGFEDQYQKRKKFSSDFFPFLKTAGNNGKKVLVIVDEAQRIPERFLKEIASWSEFAPTRVLTVILAGQLEFRTVLKSTPGPAWQDCIKVHTFLEPLNEEETKTYINKRLEMAGTNRKIFLISAVREIHAYSKGIPRMINISCDQALIAAFAKGMKIVDTPTVKQATGLLDLPAPPSKNRNEKPAENRSSHDRPWFQKKTMAGLAVAASICLFMGYLFHSGYLHLPHAIQPNIIEKTPSAPPVNIESLEHTPQEDSPPAATESRQDFKETEQPLNRTIHPIVSKAHLPDDKPLEDQTQENKARENLETDNQTTDAKLPGDQKIGLGYTPAPFSEERELPAPVLMEDIGETSRTAKTVIDTPKDMDWFIKQVFLFKEQTVVLREIPAKPEKPTGMGQLPGPTSSEPAGPTLDNPMDNSLDISKDPEPDAIIDWLFKKRDIK